MKVVVAGGSGLLGRHFVRRLVDQGESIVVLSRNPDRARARLGPDPLIVRWDGLSASGRWTRELAGADAVVNLTGASVGRWPWTAARKRTLRTSRLEPTRALVVACSTLLPDDRPGLLLSASGTDQYEGVDDQPATEATPPVNTFLGRLCQDWESEACRAESHGMRVILWRTSLVVALRAPALSRLALPFRLFLGGPIGNGSQWMSWIDLSDAIELMEWTLRYPTMTGPLNLSAPAPVRQAEFAAVLARVLGRPAAVRTPATLVRLAMGEQSTLLLGSRRVWPARALAAGYHFSHPDLEASLAEAFRRL